MNKDKLFGLRVDELTQEVVELGMRRFVGAQLADWLYKKGVRIFEQCRNLSKRDVELLGSRMEIGRSDFIDSVLSVDGTRKYIFETLRGNRVESVYIPSQGSKTLCISSQAGCKMGCRFCMTGRMGFIENLSAGEILNQVYSVEEFEDLSNIVFMGMGEPLDNVEEVLRACDVLTSPWGLGWSPTRITVSTIGVLDGLRKLLEQSRVHIAVSLHTPFSDERLELMPSERKYPLAETLRLLSGYDFTHQRRVSFEYILFAGVNDTDAHVEELARILQPIAGCRVNLIRFHQIEDSGLIGTADGRIREFNEALNSAGIRTTTRASRGEDIWAACGMLAAK